MDQPMAKKPSIPEMLDALEREVSELDEAISNLRERLGPIRRQPHDATNSGAPLIPSDDFSDVGNKIIVTRGLVRDATVKISFLHKEIEL